MIDAIEDMYKTLPFSIQAWDCDNGSEFINRYLVKHFADRKIALTRSRPYHKNDEQRNYSHLFIDTLVFLSDTVRAPVVSIGIGGHSI